MTGPSKVPTGWATQHPVPVGWMKQFRYFSRLYDMIENFPGDVVECGLGEGNTFAMLAYFIGSESRKPFRKLYGFDSFEGFPEPSEYDASPREPKAGEWKVDEEMVRKRLEESGINNTFPTLEIEITKGFLGQSLPNFPDKEIAFLHLDVDLYEGYRDGLEYLYPQVLPGGIIAFDEYREFKPNDPLYGKGTIEKWPGCTKAINDYFHDRHQIMRFYPETGKYYIVKDSL